MRGRAALAAWTALVWPALAAAQASFTAQQRTVESRSQSDLALWQQDTNPMTDPAAASYTANDNHLTGAPDFAPFSATVSSIAPPPVAPAARDGDAAASQTSSLAPNKIAATGSVSASGEALFFYPGSGVISALNALLNPPVPYIFGYLRGDESGESRLRVEFELSQPTPYHLVGSLRAGPGYPGQASVLQSSAVYLDLSGPSGTVVSDQVISCDCTHDPHLQGVLPPGSYTLSVSAGAGVGPICDLLSCYAYATDAAFDVSLSLAGAPVVPGPSRALAALLALALAAVGAAALRRA